MAETHDYRFASEARCPRKSPERIGEVEGQDFDKQGSFQSRMAASPF